MHVFVGPPVPLTPVLHTTTTLDCRYTHLVAASTGTPAAIVSGLNDSIVRDGGHRFIIQGFPLTLDAAFHFEKTITQPLFVLLDGAEGPVVDLYSKVGAARAIQGSGDAAFASAAAHFMPTVAYVLGLPGSGKTSACSLLAEAFGYSVLSIEGLVQGEVESGSRFGADIAKLVAKGDQVGDAQHWSPRPVGCGLWVCLFVVLVFCVLQLQLQLLGCWWCCLLVHFAGLSAHVNQGSGGGTVLCVLCVYVCVPGWGLCVVCVASLWFDDELFFVLIVVQVPMDWVVRLFKEAMRDDPTGYYVLDGYPRTLEQANALAEAIAPPKSVLVLDLPEKVSSARRGAAAAKGIRVYKGRTAAYVALADATGIVRYVCACRWPCACCVESGGGGGVVGRGGRGGGGGGGGCGGVGEVWGGEGGGGVGGGGWLIGKAVCGDPRGLDVMMIDVVCCVLWRSLIVQQRGRQPTPGPGVGGCEASVQP
jgi:adenylate kinase family enzyme